MITQEIIDNAPEGAQKYNEVGEATYPYLKKEGDTISYYDHKLNKWLYYDIEDIAQYYWDNVVEIYPVKIQPNTRIRILSPKHSEYVQKLAFEAGLVWGGGKKEIKNTGARFLYFDDKNISYGSFESNFDDSDFEEVSIPLPEAAKEIIDKLYINNGAPKIGSVILAEKTGSKHSHYFKDVSDLDEVDVYRVCDLFEINDASGSIQHAIKKLLCSGQRGVKDYRKDLEEARDSIQRKIDIMAEDGK